MSAGGRPPTLSGEVGAALVGPADVERWRAFDPIERYRTWLVAAGHADEGFVEACEREAEERVAQIRADVIASGPPPEAWLFDWVYAEPPKTFLRQRAEALGDG